MLKVKRHEGIGIKNKITDRINWKKHLYAAPQHIWHYAQVMYALLSSQLFKCLFPLSFLFYRRLQYVCWKPIEHIWYNTKDWKQISRHPSVIYEMFSQWFMQCYHRHYILILFYCFLMGKYRYIYIYRHTLIYAKST